MRKIAIIVLLAWLCCSVCYADDDYTAGLIADMGAVEELQAAAEAKITSFDKILYGATLDHVTINPNYGTDESGDFIALVYMNYDGISDPGTDVHTLVRVSNNIAHAIVDSVPGAVELAVFWELPGYDSQAKVSYTIDGDDFSYGDTMFPKALANAW